MQDGTFDQNPQIALVFHGPAGEYQIRTILPEQDADQRVQNFYTNFTKNLRQSSDEQFQITVRVMDGVIMMDDDDERMMVTEMVINTHTTAPCVPVQ